MKTPLPYFVKFKEDNTILAKEYQNDCIVESSGRRPSIIITHNEITFSANNSCRKVWIFKEYGILRSKRKERGIIVSDFLLRWYRLNLLSVSFEIQ